MKFYIRSKQEINYTLSEPFDTEELAEEKFNTYDDKLKKHSSIIQLPEIKLGLVLYMNGNYYKTIIGESSTLYFLRKDVNVKSTIADMVQKTSLINWFLEEKLDNVEEYNTNIEFDVINDFFDKNNEITYTENEE
jgi:hypothetical protein